MALVSQFFTVFGSLMLVVQSAVAKYSSWLLQLPSMLLGYSSCQVFFLATPRCTTSINQSINQSKFTLNLTTATTSIVQSIPLGLNSSIIFTSFAGERAGARGRVGEEDRDVDVFNSPPSVLSPYRRLTSFVPDNAITKLLCFKHSQSRQLCY